MRANGGRRLLGLAVLFGAEIVAVAALYQFAADIECRQTSALGLCEALKSLVARALVMMAAGVLLWLARPRSAQRFSTAVAGRAPGIVWPLVHLAGLTLLVVPLFLAGPSGQLSANFSLALPFWLSGAVLAATGGIFLTAAPADWRDLMVRDGPAPPVVFALAFLLPDLANLALPLWDSALLTDLTFRAVAVFLSAFSDAVTSRPQDYIIGVQAFSVHIARQCSGVEGFALVTGFVALYAFVFRAELRPFRFALIVLPLGLALSWMLNVVRIGSLILIGAHLSPEVAVNGFHSYAGWLFFTLLALGLTVFVQSMPWLHQHDPSMTGRQGRAAPPIRSDPVAAAILPFVVFMLISTVVGALAPHPELGYPVKAIVLLVAVLVFWPAWRQFGWRLWWPAVLAGLGVAAFWVALAPPPDAEAELFIAGMTRESFVSWVLLRVIGTVLLVPLVEEAFFRGYLLPRLDGASLPRRIAAIFLSSALFGLLHGRIWVAMAAGIVFALIRLKSGRTSDAVVAHVVANLVIAAIAIWRGEWSLI